MLGRKILMQQSTCTTYIIWVKDAVWYNAVVMGGSEY